ncbi:unnamed protein product [Pedinophyceae sp. YPF-701]|nr:unnamed protein product [Pedinophyceae sp. YPF-701]
MTRSLRPRPLTSSVSSSDKLSSRKYPGVQSAALKGGQPIAASARLKPRSRMNPGDGNEPLLDDLEARMRRPLDGEGDQAAPLTSKDEEDDHKSDVHASAAHLTNAIVGAGIMALPRAIAELGILLGVACLIGCMGLAVFTIESIVVTAARSNCLTSYGDLIKTRFGPRGAASLQLSIILNNFGVMCIYLLIMSDTLVGSWELPGVLPIIYKTSPGSVWWMTKPVILLVVIVGIIAPMCSLRSLKKLAPISMVSVAICASFALVALFLAGSAASQGNLSRTARLYPDARLLGRDPLQITGSILRILPIIMTAYCCHYTIHPVMAHLEGFSVPRMKRVVRTAVTICAGLYVTAGVSAYAIFGDTTRPDVLENFTAGSLDHIVPYDVALFCSTLIKVLYAGSLIGSFTLIMWALRLNAFEMAGVPVAPGQGWRWHGSGAALLAGAYACAVFLPSIWTALELVGATAVVLMSFLWPMLLLLRVEGPTLRMPTRVAAYAVILAGLLVAAIGTVGAVRDMRSGGGVAAHAPVHRGPPVDPDNAAAGGATAQHVVRGLWELVRR